MPAGIRRIALVAALALIPIAGVAGTAQAAPDHQVTLTDASGPQTWTGTAAEGSNTDYDSATGSPCPETPSGPDDYCEQTLLRVDVATPGEVEVTLADDPLNDFDLYVYKSDAAGTRGALVDSSANPQTVFELAQIGDASGYYLIQVVYFQTLGNAGYSATATLSPGEAPPPPAPDLPETALYFHDDGPPPVDGSFDATAPTETIPTIATIAVGRNNPVPARFEGNIDNGTISRLKIDFWQDSPANLALSLGEVHYQVALLVGSKRYQFPLLEEVGALEPGPVRIRHLYTAEDDGSPLPILLPGGPVTLEIKGEFPVNEAVADIYYDSTDFASGFVVNPPMPVPHAPFPADVDEPPGLQESLASDPGLGFTSHSEPHIAQSPVDPDILVAGSKMYNKDPDALDEYEFKIGTYVSFDRGRTWTDLGQLRTCPLAEAPPESWPDQNTCYPEDDPQADGPEENGPDRGEEYITSDVWIQFDDEGDAYVMVLDNPPFQGESGVGSTGWGMTMHKWESVSPQDLEPGGETWSDRIPINLYGNDDLRQDFFFDDKNTMAVNNAGPDGDGQTGIIVACWGQDVEPAKQQQVCERSTDGGETWPNEPVPISDVEALDIGTHVVADTRDPNIFYAVWLQYATQAVKATLETARTIDGGLTWHRTGVAAAFDPIPRAFPGQEFRNLSLPIMAAGPNGELYIAYADYADATDPGTDLDGRESDVKLVKSTNGGLTWSAAVNVTGPAEAGLNVNADQFQPYVAVTETGQVDVAYFDRRLDLQEGTGPTDHPGNYFTDVFLSRSNDGGATFTDARLTHDATDPEFNAPVSSSGLFFGDYQGLVADECGAVPFFNDTHLANDQFLDPGPERDPDFDDGVPSSPYQEVVSWDVPNTTAFGGTREKACGPDLAVSSTDIAFGASGKGQVRVTATIHNLGDQDATGVEVVFRVAGTQIGGVQVIPSLPAGGSADVAVTAKLKRGKTVTVIVDPNDSIAESDETNNSASRQFQGL